MALELLRRAPERFAFAVSLAGFALPGERDGDERMAQLAPPVFWGRGTADGVIPEASVARTQEWLPAHSTLDERIYEGLGHSVSELELADVAAFIAGAVRDGGLAAGRRSRPRRRRPRRPRRPRRRPHARAARSLSRSVTRIFSARTAACVARSCTSHCGGATSSALISAVVSGSVDAAAGEARVRDAELRGHHGARVRALAAQHLQPLGRVGHAARSARRA